MSTNKLIDSLDRFHAWLDSGNYESAKEELSSLARILKGASRKLCLEAFKDVAKAYQLYDKGGLFPEIKTLLEKAAQKFERAQKSVKKSSDLYGVLIEEISRAEFVITMLYPESHQDAIEMLLKVQELLDKDPFDYMKNLAKAQLLFATDQYGEASHLFL